MDPLSKTPKERIEEIMESHGYKHIYVTKSNVEKDKFIVTSINELPPIIWDFIIENFNAVMGSAKRMEFYEFEPIGMECCYNGFITEEDGYFKRH